MATFRSVLVIALLAMTIKVYAICPIGEGLSTQDWSADSPSNNQSHEPIAYRPEGKMDDGTIVLHAINDDGAASESHELLFIRPAAGSTIGDGGNLHAVTIGGEDYVIERTESVAIDQPCDGTVSVEGDEVILSIVAP